MFYQIIVPGLLFLVVSVILLMCVCILDPDIHQGVLTAHRDAVWDLVVHPTTGRLLSCAADGTCRLWDHTQSTPMLQEFVAEQSMYVCFNNQIFIHGTCIQV